MNRLNIANLQQHINEDVKLSGWVYRLRALKNVTFMVLRDRSGYVQCAMAPDLAKELTHETVVSLVGRVVEAQNTYHPFEIQVTELKVLSPAEDLPIQINQEEDTTSLNTRLNHRVLSLRHQRAQAIFHIQAQLAQAFRKFLTDQGFMEIFTPKIVKEGAEGGSEIFKLDYFGETAFLAQSPQFYKQMMVIAGFERVFEVGAVYRAESHSTVRHLNEYVSLDVEMGFITHIESLMTLETQLLQAIMQSLEKEAVQWLKQLDITLPHVPKEIPVLTLTEAISLLKDHYGRTDLEGDLDPEAEKQVSAWIKKTTGSDFVFLTAYPQSKRPMYAMPKGETLTESFDLLYKGLEITTGGLRHHTLKGLTQSMVKKGLDPSQYKSYLETFRYGAPPHGGFAIGLERLTTQLLGIDNIREARAFPRDKQRLIP